jgi:hypothetical protein
VSARYAERTEVPSDRSRAEIEKTLQRYGHLIKFHPRGCWEWIGTISPRGYGMASTSKFKGRAAHRLIYEAFREPIPPGLDLDHLCQGDLCPGGTSCQHRRCVNPAHLRPATRRENVTRGVHISQIAHRAGTCIRGHAMDLANTYVSPKGQRHCRTCRAIRDQKRQPRTKKAA